MYIIIIIIKLVNNGNWTEWSAIWSGIIRVICDHKYDFRPKLYDKKFHHHFIAFFWDRKFNPQNKFRHFGLQNISLIQYIKTVCRELQKLSLIVLKFDWFL